MDQTWEYLFLMLMFRKNQKNYFLPRPSEGKKSLKCKADRRKI